ncbi:MAG: Na+/H+ antiporter subunit G [OCS116 cluster bacterium]|uniref:Na+/H+ antiporter subunit G n=1 Tax=OCS116 cluster bacterium TaxID=2030921 RepID=A0A2A4Z9E6_9PROT|nr:Na+/H+ antiporter subunit G [OCS116 cluster bacterium]
MIIELIIAALIVIGAAFSLIGALGVLRFQDVYVRMHAASKAGTLGAGLLLLGVAVASAELGLITRSIAGVLFLILTTPVSAHLLARASVIAGVKTCDRTVINLIEGKYSKDGQTLDGHK